MLVSRNRCVFLFSRSPRHEAWAKGLPQAAELVAFSARRVAEACARLGVDLVWIGDTAPVEGLQALPQRGATFAERLWNAFADVRALGYRDVVAVPTDVPELSRTELGAAFDGLATCDVVVGPSPDGGVYLLATRENVEDRLSAVRWLTSSVFADLCREARASGLGLAALPPLADVDSLRDLSALARGTTDPVVTEVLRRLLAGEKVQARHAVVPVGASRRRRAVSRGPPLAA